MNGFDVRVRKRILAACLGIAVIIVLTAWFSKRAEAHFLSVVPRESETALGREHTVYTSLTHVTDEGQYYLGFASGSPFNHDVSRDVMIGRFIYSDGTSTHLPIFEDYNLSHTQSPDFYDSHKAKGTIEKLGTVVVDVSSQFDFPPAMIGNKKMRVFTHSKQMLNLVSDSNSRRRTAPNNYVEIEPLSDIANAEVGETLKFKLMLGDKALSGDTVLWSDEQSDIYIDKEEGPMNQRELCKTAEDGTFEYKVKNKGWQFLGAERIAAPGSGGRDADAYMSTLLFYVKENKGSSGCNAGAAAGFWGILAVLASLPLAKVVFTGSSRQRTGKG